MSAAFRRCRCTGLLAGALLAVAAAGAAPALEPPVLSEVTAYAREAQVRWIPPATRPAAYDIYRATAPGGPYTRINDAEVTGAFYTDTGLEPQTRYCWVVRSRSGQDESAPSNEVCATTGQVNGIFRRGNVNSDARINLTDAVNIMGYLFMGERTVITCKNAGDVDDDGHIALTDPIYLLSFLFQGGDDPPPPGPHCCGIDPSPDLAAGTDIEDGCEVDDPCPPPRPGIACP